MPEQRSKTPESEEIKGEEELLTNVIHFPAGRHVWRQQGSYLVCKECPLTHAVYVGINKIMVGEDEGGRPKLRDKVSI